MKKSSDLIMLQSSLSEWKSGEDENAYKHLQDDKKVFEILGITIKNMRYHFKIYNEDIGFWAQCIEFEGCITQADTIKQLKNNIKEALSLYLKKD